MLLQWMFIDNNFFDWKKPKRAAKQTFHNSEKKGVKVKINRKNVVGIFIS
jgi:hypothetical protein